MKIFWKTCTHECLSFSQRAFLFIIIFLFTAENIELVDLTLTRGFRNKGASLGAVNVDPVVAASAAVFVVVVIVSGVVTVAGA